MADIETSAWSETAANNISPAPDGWPPNSSPNIVYTTDRETMGALKRDWNRRNATIASGGTANALTLTYAVNPTALVRGQRYSFVAGATNTGAATLAVGGLAAAGIYANATALVGGELRAGQITEVMYDGANFQLIAGSGATAGISLPLSGGTLTGNLAVTPGTPSAQISVTASGGQSVSLNAGTTGVSLNLNKAATSGQDDGIFGLTNNLKRWLLDLGNNTAESGGNAGSDFTIQRYTDAGAYIDTPLAITRSNGQVTLSQSLIVASFVQANGHVGHAGITGAYQGNQYNLYYNSGVGTQLWIDNSNQGNITTSSDYRIKQDIAPLPSTWERVKALKPISYKHKDYTPPWALPKDDGSKSDPLFLADGVEHWGFIAHELQETLIEGAATGKKDEENLIQSPNWMPLVATLTRALQEAMKRIEALEARLPLAPETA